MTDPIDTTDIADGASDDDRPDEPVLDPEPVPEEESDGA